MKRKIAVALLLAATTAHLIVRFSTPVVSQDNGVEITKSIVVVDTSADLAGLARRDGLPVLIKNGANKGIWQYDKTSADAVNGTTVLDGPGSVGRFLLITLNVGTGSLDSIASLPAKTAYDLDPESSIAFGYYDSTENTSYQVPLDELLKKSQLTTVALVADLFSQTHATDNQLFLTLGYESTGVGSNLYRYDADSTATVDGGFVLPGVNGTLTFSGTTYTGNSGTGRYLAIEQTVADVTKFGATTTSDATSAILRAVATSNRIFVPSGEYSVTTIPLAQACTVYGEEYSTLVASSAQTPINITASYVTIRDIVIDGDNVTDTAVSIGSNASHVTLDRCELKNTTRYGVYIGNVSHYTRIINNYIHDVHSPTEITPCSAIHMNSTTAAATLVHGMLITNNRIDNIYNDSVSGAGTGQGIYIKTKFTTSLTDAIIEGNTVRRCSGTGIGIIAPGVMVKNNVIRMSTPATGPDPTTGINLQAKDCTAIGNYIYGPCTDQAILISSAVTGVSVTNNSIDLSTHSNTSADGIAVTFAAKYANICGNTITGTHRYGIRISAACEGLSVANNVSQGASGTAFMVEAAITGCVFTGNVGIDYAAYLFDDNGLGTTANCKLIGNTSDGGGLGNVTSTFAATAQTIGSDSGFGSILSGTGTPEGAVTAVVGTLFLRTDGGAGTSMYIKESGTGNTGWVAK